MWSDSETAKMYWRKYRARRYEERKQAAIELLGGKCVDCGANCNLEFDHMDPATKQNSISAILLHGWAKVLAELSKCTLRCKGCHKIRSQQQRSVGHGEGASGKKNCKCRACLDKKNEYMKSWKKGLRAGAQAGLASRP